MEDMGLYVFRLERGDKVKYNFKQWPWLEVTALTQKPDIFIPEELEPGRPVKALCVFNLTSELCPAPTFSWMGAAVTTQRTQLRSAHYSVLSFSPRLQDQDTELTCRVDFPLSARSTHESVRLSVRLRLVGKGGCLAQVVLVAIGEAVAKILLLLGLCLILRLRSHSKDETREARGTQDTSQVER
ncbi:sialic acid-binding Ig-like lectin 16 [Ochotona curzoniae]|uniref:sialic acid-binding Ig-like lectin 16 n=1 Tax=Ochotona curzoniae TaxID=130825 RepID=UPI001B34F087|nr:sialic acid-binding Ig-like lectin 16 [Ochotona curzoniae]